MQENVLAQIWNRTELKRWQALRLSSTSSQPSASATAKFLKPSKYWSWLVHMFLSFAHIFVLCLFWFVPAHTIFLSLSKIVFVPTHFKYLSLSFLDFLYVNCDLCQYRPHFCPCISIDNNYNLCTLLSISITYWWNHVSCLHVYTFGSLILNNYLYYPLLGYIWPWEVIWSHCE